MAIAHARPLMFNIFKALLCVRNTLNVSRTCIYACLVTITKHSHLLWAMMILLQVYWQPNSYPHWLFLLFQITAVFCPLKERFPFSQNTPITVLIFRKLCLKYGFTSKPSFGAHIQNEEPEIYRATLKLMTVDGILTLFSAILIILLWRFSSWKIQKNKVERILYL